jgi:hypothetical protein
LGESDQASFRTAGSTSPLDFGNRHGRGGARPPTNPVCSGARLRAPRQSLSVAMFHLFSLVPRSTEEKQTMTARDSAGDRDETQNQQDPMNAPHQCERPLWSPPRARRKPTVKEQRLGDE